jgi:hypothetical protein
MRAILRFHPWLNLRDTSPYDFPTESCRTPRKSKQGVPTMAAMKPRTGDGPMEVTKEARSLVMRIPLEGGGRLVVELNPQEANNLSAALEAAVALIKK